jgi:aerobic-type carbon monoxide dehydrogenase small subunit (CoxS/CutS family)
MPDGSDRRLSEELPSKNGVSRRSFMKTLGVSAAASSIAATLEAKGAAALGDTEATVTGPDPAEITLDINGKQMKVTVEPGTTLLEALRVNLGLTGSKEICDRGACGGCSVLMDGMLINSCLTLAHDAIGTKITTVEGLSKDGKMDPIQEAFVRHDAMQCGYCTPGFVVASRALLNAKPKPTLEEIKHWLGGNICRCGTYGNMFNAILEASGQPVIMDQKA